MRTWIRDPIAMLSTGGKRGLVVEDGKIIELVEQNGPASTCDEIFDARRHVIIPGLVNAHHHFLDADARSSAGHQQAAFSVAEAALSDLGRPSRSRLLSSCRTRRAD
jgi:cytosine/adenosine deaminase-related metal-dependent hydrolase